MANSLIYFSELTHYFNADEYEEIGYQRAITGSVTFVNPSLDLFQKVTKFVSQTIVELYDFAWLDTSVINIFNLGKTFFNYKIRDQEKRDIVRVYDYYSILTVEYS